MLRCCSVFFCFLFCFTLIAEPLTIAVLRYQGGDWYSCIPSVRNFVNKIQHRFKMKIEFTGEGYLPGQKGFYRIPFYIVNGHGQVLFTAEQRAHLKRYLQNGGFLFANDDFGMDRSFRELLRQLFPAQPLIRLSRKHPLYSSWYRLPAGLPKIHKHGGQLPAGYGLLFNGRLVLFYAFESDIVDGWDRAKVHRDPKKIRELAFQAGYNILYYALTR